MFGYATFWLATLNLLMSQDLKVIDSLKHEMLNKSVGEKIEPTIQLALQYITSDKGLCVQYLKEAKELAFVFGDTAKIVRSSRMLGEVLRRFERTDEALKLLGVTLPIARRNGLKSDVKYILNSLALAYTTRADYDKALECHFESLAIREQEGDKREISISLNNIGLVYFKLGDHLRSVDFYSRSLKVKREEGDNYDLDRLLINLGLCYNQLKSFSRAQDFFNEALSRCNESCADEIVVEGQFGLGVSKYGEGKLDEALAHFDRSLQIARQIDYKTFQAENLTYKGKVFIAMNEREKAVVTLKEAESLASNARLTEILIDVYRQFSVLFNKTNDFTNAALYQGKYISLKDSVYSQSLISNLAKVQTDFAERENIAIIASKEVVIKQQRYLNLAIGFIALLAGLLLIVLQRSNRIFQRVNTELTEAKEIIQGQNQMLRIRNEDLDRQVAAKTLDLERVNHSLQKVNEELDNFIYKTSHDIRGPLASLKGMCNVALMDVKDPVALNYLHKLDNTAERLNTILTRLLIINQINNSRLLVVKIDFKSIVDEVLLLEQKKGLPSKIRIEKNISADAAIYSDREMVRIILENLIDNAIKFYNDSERVQSFVKINIHRLPDGNVQADVIDNGIGIKETDPDKLFQMFFRASERSEIGGIGLYIVKTATAKLGGNVVMYTSPEGYTVFSVHFPVTIGADINVPEPHLA